MKKKKNEFENFNRVVGKILSVPHNAIKSQLDSEREDKKKKESKPSSASREAADKD